MKIHPLQSNYLISPSILLLQVHIRFTKENETGLPGKQKDRGGGKIGNGGMKGLNVVILPVGGQANDEFSFTKLSGLPSPAY